MKGKGFSIISGTEKNVEDALNNLANNPFFKILDIHFSVISENYGEEDKGRCYTALVYYEKKFDEK